MWYPFPLLLPAMPMMSPNTYLPSGMSYGSGMAQLQIASVDHLVYPSAIAELLVPKDGREFLLNRSVFDLVKVTEFLELTDPRLLGWYLSLPLDDRTLILESGGFLQFLQRHPALVVAKNLVFPKHEVRGSSNQVSQTMAANLNKSRRPTFYGVKECLNCGTSCASRGRRCRRCSAPFQKEILYSDQETELCLLPSNVKEELDLFSDVEGRRGGEGVFPCDPISPVDSPLVNLQESFQSACDTSSQVLEVPPSQQGAPNSKVQVLSQLWEEEIWQNERSSVTVYKDPSAQASFSLDGELDMHSQKGVVGSQGGPPGAAPYAGLDQETLPDYYSFTSTSLNDSSQSVEPEQGDSLMSVRGSSEQPSTLEDPLEEEGVSVTSSSPGESEEHSLNGSCDWTCSHGERTGADADSGSEREHGEEDYHSIMEEDRSILMCKAGETVGPVNRVHGQVPRQAAVTSMATRSIPRPTHKPLMTDRSTSTLPPVQTRDIGTGPDPGLAGTQQHTQTQNPVMADKFVNTEVHMADLDFLAEEFMKLKAAEEELKELKVQIESSVGAGSNGESGCSCGQRAQRAELCLLALQFGMCQQHCWRRYYTSPEGDRLVQGTEGISDNVMKVLQVLEEDYREMRGKILSGVPLDQLKPLTVDSQKITSAALYIPAQIIGESLGCVPSNVPKKSSQESDEGGKICPPVSSGADPQAAERGSGPVNLPKSERSETGKTVSVLPQQMGTDHGHKPGGERELNSSEAWYDAEEDLVSAGKTKTTEAKDEGAVRGQRTHHTSLLCVTGLPSDVTEDDIMVLFEKYQASEVSISTFSNNLKVAIVTISSPESADRAMDEVNGQTMQGHMVHVELIQRSRSGGPGQAQSQGRAPQPQSSGAGLRPGPSGDTQGHQRSSKSSSTTTSAKLYRPSLEKRTVVCDSPTASGTCLPQHYATMGSFDTLMARLTQRHPEAGRQRIVDALLELRAKHQGYLSGLPLSMIVEMTSDLLAKSSNTAS